MTNNDPAAGTCPVCGSRDTVGFCDIYRMPVFANVLCATKQAALAVPRGDILLAFCRSCAAIWNRAFEPELMEYAPDYENALHFSPRFQAYAADIARRLVEKYALVRKRVLDIGCGDGAFLSLLCDLGGNCGLGIDPGFDPARLRVAPDDRVEFIRDRYSDKYVGLPADLICCRHVLEHVADPLAFLRLIRRAADDRRQTVVFFEVPNAMFTLRDLGIWDLIYEHCSYFCEPALRTLFERAGFRVLDAHPEFGDQFLALEAVPAAHPPPGSPPPDAVDAVRCAVEAFADAYRRQVQEWEDRLSTFAGTGRRMVLWGAGSKGVSFVNTLGAARAVEYLVDVNPRKHGMYVSGTGHRIVPPGFLCDYRPHSVLVMNRLYEEEVRRNVHQLGIEAEFLVA